MVPASQIIPRTEAHSFVTEVAQSISLTRNPILIPAARPSMSRPKALPNATVDQRMRLECGVGFHQLRTCRRTRPGLLRLHHHLPISTEAAAGFLQIGIRECASRALTGSHISCEMTAFHPKCIIRGVQM